MFATLRTLPLALLRRVTGRQAVLLAPEARAEHQWLRVESAYRVIDGVLAARVGVDVGRGAGVGRGVGRGMSDDGQLSVEARGYAGHFPGRVVWRSTVVNLSGDEAALSLDLTTGAWRGVAPSAPVASGGAVPGWPFPTRRFVLDWTVVERSGRTVRRRTGHYLAGGNRPVDAEYFGGDNYVDHEAESAAEHPAIVALVEGFVPRGARVLEVGCATGGLVAALREAGFAAVGADFSAWAVAEARTRLGGAHAFQWDVSAGPAPAELLAHGPFDALVFWVTLEHFSDPWSALRALSPMAAPGARLFIKTTNADSLTHRIFGADWEGYFDWTHLGVDTVGVRSLRAELPALGWTIEQLATEQLWDSNADATHQTLRDWHAHDARFRQLLTERDLGDLVTLVARRA